MYHFLFLLILSLIIFFRPLICAEAHYVSNLIFNIVIFFITILFLLISGRGKLNIQVANGDRNFLFRKNAVNLFLFVFIVILIAGLFISINKNRSFNYFFVIFSGVCLFYVVAGLNKKYTLFLLKVFLISAFLVTIYGIYQYFWGFEILREQVEHIHPDFLNIEDFKKRLFENRIYSTFVYAPALAGFLLITISVTISFVSLYFKKALSIFLYVFLSLQIFALFLTFSKAGFLLFFVILLFFAYLMRAKAQMRIVCWTIVAFLLFFNIFLLLAPADFPTLENFKSSYNYRLGHIRAALTLLKIRPLSGFGLMTFGLSSTKVISPVDKETQYVHNSYLQIAQEVGILGIGALIGFFIFYFKNFIPYVIKRVKSDKILVLAGGILTGIAAFCLHSAVDNDFYFAQILMSVFFLMGAVVSFCQLDWPLFSKRIRYLIKILVIILCVFGIIYSYLCLLSFYNTRLAEAESGFKEKIKQYSLALKSNPFDDAIYYKIANLYEDKYRELNDKEDKELAENFYQQAIAYNKMLAFYRYSLGNLYFYSYTKSKNNDLLSQAIEQLDKAIYLYPAKPYYRFYVSNLLHIAGDDKRAIIEREKAQELKKIKEAK